MMKLQTYAGFSLIATLAVIYHAFSSRGQFYPSMVYLSTSKISLVLLLNMGLVVMCILWQLTKKIFLGSLREAEVERLNEQAWREVMEILFAITIFRQDFSVSFIAMVTALLLIKALHWLAQKRVEYIETTPSVPKLSHIRIVSFMGFLLLIDCSFLYNSVKYLIETRQASVSLFFAFEYMILATTTVSTIVKYVFYVSDMLMEGQWEKKAVYTFYLELVRDLLHLTMNYGVPLHLIRELYETFRNFKIRVADYIRYRKITSNMNDRFPDATPEEINTALVVPPENVTSSTGLRADGQQQGTSTPGTSSQGTVGDRAGNDNVSPHQARLQAAASAASIYEKSFVYPSPNTILWSPGYSVLPQTFGHPGNIVMTNNGVDGAVSGVSQHYPQKDLQVKLIEHQIELLQRQLQLLQTSNSEKKMDIATSDIKGKLVSSPYSSIVDSKKEIKVLSNCIAFHGSTGIYEEIKFLYVRSMVYTFYGLSAHFIGSFSDYGSEGGAVLFFVDLQFDCSADRISQLPDDILLFILSLLPFKEAIATSILSRRWRYLWTFIRRLDFDGTELLLKVESTKEDHKIVLDNERRNYVRWVDHVIASHKGSAIEEFRVFFNLDKAYEKSIDGWLRFALSRKVQKLELNLTEAAFTRSRKDHEFYTFPYTLMFAVSDSSIDFNFKYLKKLSLNCVNVNGEALEFFLRQCPLLEHLSVSRSLELTALKIIGPFPSFKRLEIISCHNLNSVEIRDANLVHLTYRGYKIQFLLENVPMLVEMFIGGMITNDLKDVLLMLSSYLPQLEILGIRRRSNFTWKETTIFYSTVKMSNLKQLLVEVHVFDDESLLSLTNLIRASPCLERFVLEAYRDEPKFVKRKLKKIVTPYIHLKELKFVGYFGVKSDLELVMHFLENAASLEKVVVDSSEPSDSTYVYVWKYNGPFADEFIEEERESRTRAKKQFKKIKVHPRIDFQIL
ncbi:hypothetical protein DH2020_049900 [Rehmannia glutinosa]|uniref:F-box domain-containing protein n=1 Tax=Rehmannia glutinosa TaxID=99300 RepID=A0ABR0U1Q9_REHGL